MRIPFGLVRKKKIPIITVRKRTLGQRNVFTRVCDSLCPRGGECIVKGVCVSRLGGPGVCVDKRGVLRWVVDTPPRPRGSHPRTRHPLSDSEADPRPVEMVTEAGSTHHTGKHSCFKSV